MFRNTVHANFNLIQLFVSDSEILWTIAHKASLSMEFDRQEYWSRLPWPPPGDLPDPEIKLASLRSLALQADSLLTEPSGKPHKRILLSHKKVQNNAICSNMGGPRGSHTE